METLQLMIPFSSFVADLMEGLREIPGRDALKLRAEVNKNIFFILFWQYLNVPAIDRLIVGALFLCID